MRIYDTIAISRQLLRLLGRLLSLEMRIRELIAISGTCPQSAVARRKACPPSDRQREGPEECKSCEQDEAGFGREEVSAANGTFRGRAAAAA